MISTVRNTSLKAALAIGTFLAGVSPALAQGYMQGNLFGSVPSIGGNNGDIRVSVLNILRRILSFMALVAVVFIVIAGIRLVVSQGEEGEKDKAKKTILYVIIGLVVILFAQAIVTFVANTLAGN